MEGRSNSFLATGGDNFRAFAGGTNRNDTGKSDLATMVDHLAANRRVEVDHSQRAVSLGHDRAKEDRGGDEITVDVSSWSFSAPGSVQDSEVVATLDGTVVGRATRDNTVGAAPLDTTGSARLLVHVPQGLAAGAHELVLTGARTGTASSVPITAAAV